jgi:hypothetical protein
VEARCGAEHHGADHVGEARRARVFDRPLADQGLYQLEVGEAREAPASAECEADRELRRQEREQRPPAGEERGERQRPDHGLVEARRPRVDDVEVAVGVG